MSSIPKKSMKKMMRKMESPSGFKLQKVTVSGKRAMQKVLSKGASNVVSGHGDFMSSLADLVRGPVKGVKTVADVVSGLTGKALKLIGDGDYTGARGMDMKVNANSFLTGTQTPEIVNRGQAYIMRHAEYVADIAPSVTFVNTQYPLQPALARAFPWLRNVAANFAEYQILGALLQYRPLVSPNHVNASGEVIYSVDYNAGTPAPLSKVQSANADYATSCAPWERMVQALECDPKQTTFPHRYIRTGAVPSGQDPKTYDWGNINISTQGQANTTGSLGELYIIYEIAFFKPVATAGLGLSILTDSFTGTFACTAATNIFANITILPNANSSLGLTWAATQFNFPSYILQGSYLFTITFTANAVWSASANWGGPPGGANVNLLQVWSGPTADNAYTYVPQSPGNVATVAATGNVLQMMFIVSVNAPGSSIATISFPSLSSAITNSGRVDVIATQLNSSVLF